ncbi:MBL fold metallo-hydrolase [Cochlodiniinecator piscidefendens]|uniref:MBL fold metallo-hydrolase n=1 Tax=Cochlodiniinecator piscidefendens TaxID=2715756 RepID=UPI00140A0A8B|nr:MBL fold metallo-hydrolase [Cochlodiniinecator piscidefendens]
MKQLYPDLWQTPVEMRFGTLRSHAYLLEHRQGRDLIYVPENVDTHRKIIAMDGIEHLYLSHNHDIVDTLNDVKSNLSATLTGHYKMDKFFPENLALDLALTPDGTETQPSGLEVIYVPGHTDNSTCFRYVSPHGKTYLFVGDIIYPDQGAWRALVMQSHGGDKHTLTQSLELLKNIQADVIIPSVGLGDVNPTEMTQPEWHAALNAAKCSL